jgi:NCAIR mutase (PurE)-related protein
VARIQLRVLGAHQAGAARRLRAALTAAAAGNGDGPPSAAYLRHHLALAGREEPLCADDAIARLHRVASGLPRALNNAATALIAAAAAGKDLVDDACATKAVVELTRD